MTPQDQSYREIPLTQGQVARVSAHRFEELSKYNWCAYWNDHTRSYYAGRRAIGPNGKPEFLRMHRHILGLTKGDKKVSDHINHDTLDNTDDNLRIVDYHESNLNRRMGKRSGTRGISKHGKGWRVRLWINGKDVHIGTRPDMESAKELLFNSTKHYT